MKNVKSPFIYLVWSVLRFSGFVSLSVSPKAAEEGASVLSHLKLRSVSAGFEFFAALLIEVSPLSGCFYY